MGSWSAGAGNYGTLYLQTSLNWQNASTNQSSVHVKIYVHTSSSTALHATGSWSWSGYGSSGGNGSLGYSWTAGDHVLGEGDFTVGHDANGNYSTGISANFNGNNSPYLSAASINVSESLPRLGLAPNIAANISDQVTDTTVRLGTEINNYGHGTSAATHMYWKRPEDGGWSQTSDQGDAAGYNYWTVTGLIPNTKYYRLARWWNNNGDQSDLPSPFPDDNYYFVTLATLTETSKSVLATTADFVLASRQGFQATTSKIQYRKQGDTTWLDSPTATGATPTVSVSGLLPNTTYEYRTANTTAAGTYTGTTQTLTTLPAGKLIYPDGTVKNAIPRRVNADGTTTMLNITTIH